MRHAFQIALESFEHLEIENMFFAKQVFQKWPQIVGHLLSEKVKPNGYWKHTAYLLVNDSIWKQEILLRKDKILSELNSFYPDKNLFQDLKINLRQHKKGSV